MSDDGNPVFVGLGSNLGDPVAQVKAALMELGAIHETRLLNHSRLYRSPAMGPAGQPDYINAVAMIVTELDPQGLLDALMAIERAHGRVRDGERWGPRTLDLDILLFRNLRYDRPGLKIPHPGLTERSFVLYPLAELAPDIDIPGAGNLRQHLRRIPADGLEVVAH